MLCEECGSELSQQEIEDNFTCYNCQRHVCDNCVEAVNLEPENHGFGGDDWNYTSHEVCLSCYNSYNKWVWKALSDAYGKYLDTQDLIFEQWKKETLNSAS